MMYTLINNKLPILHLKFKKYKKIHENDSVTHYQKEIITRNEYHYPKIYYINIFHHKKDADTDICVSVKEYFFELEEYRYDWYSGEYENKTIPIIEMYDRKLLKYIKHS